MPFGDVGGAVTELIITCRTKADGPVNIAKGDAVKLCGDYTVCNQGREGQPVFGQAMASAGGNDNAIPVKVRGICVFQYRGAAPQVDGAQGVVMAGEFGEVRSAHSVWRGINLRVDEMTSQVHVLM